MPAIHPSTAERTEPLISIIVPAVNEEATLAATLESVRAATVPLEIIVIDAGSTDATTAISRGADARVIETQRRQRACQLNVGARYAQSGILVFLHADTILPHDGLNAVLKALRNPAVFGGAFTRCYASSSAVLRFTFFLTRLRNHLIGWHLGDQAMFVRRATFFQLGGFREVDQFEDLDFSRRLRRFGRTVTLRECVTSSARRFDRFGPATTTWRDLMLTRRYLTRGLVPTTSRASLAYERAETPSNLERR
jgi:rSAM/selenodomain-associated transferase 2